MDKQQKKQYKNTHMEHIVHVFRRVYACLHSIVFFPKTLGKDVHLKMCHMPKCHVQMCLVASIIFSAQKILSKMHLNIYFFQPVNTVHGHIGQHRVASAFFLCPVCMRS